MSQTTCPSMASDYLSAVQFDVQGLVPVIAQDEQSGQVLMFAFMNAEALIESIQSGYAVYWSRSRQRLWRKGEESGHRQRISEIRLDCDGDVILIKIAQQGGIACHTGRQSCFYLQLQTTDHAPKWVAVDPVVKDPELIYGKH